MVAQLAKGIKPKKLKVDKVRLELLNALRAEGRIVKKEFEKTIATWKGEKPKFEIAISLSGGDATVLIGPGGSPEGAQKWVWLDEGVKRHPISAKNAPLLIFRDSRGGGFKPKTKVKTFSSSAGSNTGPWISKKQVDHPGIEAREWSKTIVKQRRKPFTKAMIKAASV